MRLISDGRSSDAQLTTLTLLLTIGSVPIPAQASVSYRYMQLASINRPHLRNIRDCFKASSTTDRQQQNSASFGARAVICCPWPERAKNRV